MSIPTAILFARLGDLFKEHMIIIPHRLMMSEVHAMSDPELGHVFRDKIPILKSDNGLALYLMQQTLKGDESFYWPYLRILPNEPRNLAHWDESRLFELQDHDLVRRRASRKKHIASLYDRTMKILGGSYPDLFSVSARVVLAFKWRPEQRIQSRR